MPSSSDRWSFWKWGAFAMCLCLMTTVVVAEEARPTPTPTPTPTPVPRSLSDVAKNTKLGGQGDAGQGLVITNENLAAFAEKGSLTFVEDEKQKAGTRAARPGAAGLDPEFPDDGLSPSEEESKKKLWRGKYEAQLRMVEGIEARIAELDLEIPGLWTKFYSWDDPAYRDGVIKVALDEAVANRDRLEKQLVEEQAKLPKIRDDARRDGAQPGWFRGFPSP